MEQAIVDFELDDDRHWRAILACGHRQHVRHDPPLRVREWVLTKEGRDGKVGVKLSCLKCDDEGAPH